MTADFFLYDLYHRLHYFAIYVFQSKVEVCVDPGLLTTLLLRNCDQHTELCRLIMLFAYLKLISCIYQCIAMHLDY